MNLLHDIASGDENTLNVIIEIPKFSRIKYEMDKETGLIKLDRVLYSPMHYPMNYGFVPRTLWDDGDPLDVFVLSHEPFVPLCLLEARPIGALPMIDGGDDDIKILAVPVSDPRFFGVKDISDIESHILEETAHFLKVYKELQKKEVKVGKWGGAPKAKAAVKKSIKLYQEKYGK